MKIRHKKSGVVIEGTFIPVIGEWTGACWYGDAGNAGGSRYSAEDWEEVKQEPVWVDVTAECAVSDDGEVIMRDGRVFSRCPVGYRLRKVKLYVGYCSTEQQDAFIIERKEPA